MSAFGASYDRIVFCIHKHRKSLISRRTMTRYLTILTCGSHGYDVRGQLNFWLAYILWAGRFVNRDRFPKAAHGRWAAMLPGA